MIITKDSYYSFLDNGALWKQKQFGINI
jgi:hypothetical protein